MDFMKPLGLALLFVCLMFGTAFGGTNISTSLHPGDFNGDGLGDVLHVVNNNGKLGLQLFLSDSKNLVLSWQKDTFADWIGLGDNCKAFFAGDVNADHKTDLVYVYELGGHIWLLTLLSDGHQMVYGGNQDMQESILSLSVIPGDFDGDGRMDVAQIYPSNSYFEGTELKIPSTTLDHSKQAYNWVRVFRAPTDGNFNKWQEPWEFWLNSFVEGDDQGFFPGDFDGDGKTDLLQVSSNPITKGLFLHRFIVAGYKRLKSDLTNYAGTVDGEAFLTGRFCVPATEGKKPDKDQLLQMNYDEKRAYWFLVLHQFNEVNGQFESTPVEGGNIILDRNWVKSSFARTLCTGKESGYPDQVTFVCEGTRIVTISISASGEKYQISKLNDKTGGFPDWKALLALDIDGNKATDFVMFREDGVHILSPEMETPTSTMVLGVRENKPKNLLMSNSFVYVISLFEKDDDPKQRKLVFTKLPILHKDPYNKVNGSNVTMEYIKRGGSALLASMSNNLWNGHGKPSKTAVFTLGFNILMPYDVIAAKNYLDNPTPENLAIFALDAAGTKYVDEFFPIAGPAEKYLFQNAGKEITFINGELYKVPGIGVAYRELFQNTFGVGGKYLNEGIKAAGIEVFQAAKWLDQSPVGAFAKQEFESGISFMESTPEFKEAVTTAKWTAEELDKMSTLAIVWSEEVFHNPLGTVKKLRDGFQAVGKEISQDFHKTVRVISHLAQAVFSGLKSIFSFNWL